jgi:hypothetical protein
MKVGRIRAIIFATDPEDSEVVAEKLAEIASTARSSGVPVLHALTRRGLAKALGDDMRQTAIGVLDPDGVYDEFKAIRDFALAS